MRRLTTDAVALAALLLAPVAAAGGPAAAPTPATPATAERRVDSIAPGLTRTSLRYGEPASATRHVVVAGVERRQADADRLLDAVERLGFAAQPLHGVDGYEVRAIGFSGLAAAERARAALVAAGIDGARTRAIGHDLTAPAGPFAVEVLEVDPAAIDVVVAHAADASHGLETTSELARRRGALAAVNGGYFRDGGALAGENQGLLLLDGRLLSEPDRGRAGVAFYEEAGFDRALFDRLGWCGAAHAAGGAAIAVDGVDRPRRDGEVLLYTAAFGAETPAADGVELTLTEGRVGEVRRGSGAIPRGGAVLSFAPRTFPAGFAAPGEALAVELRIVPLGGDPGALWREARSGTGGGPLLLAGGRRALAPASEAISRVFTESRHPRTAAATRADGTLLFVTVDGRRPEWSVGMTLGELANLLLSLGATDAVNLDGGGSTTMVVGGRVVNRTSDLTGERPVGDAVLLFAR
jgi:hypothetical protein